MHGEWKVEACITLRQTEARTCMRSCLSSLKLDLRSLSTSLASVYCWQGPFGSTSSSTHICRDGMNASDCSTAQLHDVGLRLMLAGCIGSVLLLKHTCITDTFVLHTYVNTRIESSSVLSHLCSAVPAVQSRERGEATRHIYKTPNEQYMSICMGVYIIYLVLIL